MIIRICTENHKFMTLSHKRLNQLWNLRPVRTKNLYETSEPQHEPETQTIPEEINFNPPPKPKKPFSPIPLLLIAGVGFIFLGGVIFLTSTWELLPNPVRAIALLSASVIAFGVNHLAEKVLKLPKTGLAFYILGCIFLPLALGGIGQFELFGHWFSFHGDGKLLLQSVIYLCIAGTAYLGRYNYQSKFLAWLSLSGITGAYFYFTKFLAVIVLRENTFHQVAGVLFAIGATFWAEWYLKRKPDTPTAKACIWFLYPMLYVFLFTLTKADAFPKVVLSLIMAILFVNERFLRKNLHWGVFGFGLAMLYFGHWDYRFPVNGFSFRGGSLFTDDRSCIHFHAGIREHPEIEAGNREKFQRRRFSLCIACHLYGRTDLYFSR